MLVLGLGPAGRAIAYRCAAAGLRVTALDPHPDRLWTSTFGAWADELPAWLSPAVVAARVERPAVRVRDSSVLARRYLVFDTPALQRSLSLSAVHVMRGSAVKVGPDRVELHDGSLLRGRVVVDCRGLWPERRTAEQTAFGLIVDAAAAAPALGGREAWFMDWRADNGAPAGSTPSFLYAIPLGGDRVLLEETCLAGRPGLGQAELRQRLVARLAARGVALSGEEQVERVRFPLHPAAGQTRDSRPLAYGSRGGLTHPATGFSVAASLAWADGVAQSLAAGEDPARLLWPRRARLVSALRMRGMEVLLALPPAQLQQFFAAYFRIPARRQRAYLSDRAAAGSVAMAMAATFVRLPVRVKARVAWETARGAARSLRSA